MDLITRRIQGAPSSQRVAPAAVFPLMSHGLPGLAPHPCPTRALHRHLRQYADQPRGGRLCPGPGEASHFYVGPIVCADSDL